MRESETERAAEKWRGAGRRENRGEDTLKERSRVALFRRPAKHTAARELRQRDLEDTEKIERENEDYRAHADDEKRVRELKGPG